MSETENWRTIAVTPLPPDWLNIYEVLDCDCYVSRPCPALLLQECDNQAPRGVRRVRGRAVLAGPLSSRRSRHHQLQGTTPALRENHNRRAVALAAARQEPHGGPGAQRMTAIYWPPDDDEDDDYLDADDEYDRDTEDEP